MTLILRGDDVRVVLDLPSCIDVVERAFRMHAAGETIGPGVLGAPVESGGFHVKTAGIRSGRPLFAAKVNANFPGNPARTGLPTIQGVLALFDASDGRVLALLDSTEITSIRTAAATAVAAKHLAHEAASTVTVCGCGEQGRSQLRALACVRAVRRAFAFDVDAERSAAYAREMSAELSIDVAPVHNLEALRTLTDIWVTCTPAQRSFLGRNHVSRGAFIAAVGADHPEKQEIDVELLAASVVVADLLEQCATMGDLHHALDAGAMQRSDVRAELADVVSGRIRGRQSDDEIIVFDSTGTALQDVAAASLAYDRAVATRIGFAVNLGRVPLPSRDAVAATVAP